MTTGRTAARGEPGRAPVAPRWRGELVERARADLRRAAAEGDRRARQALLEGGEDVPAPRHWADVDAERDEDGG